MQSDPFMSHSCIILPIHTYRDECQKICYNIAFFSNLNIHDHIVLFDQSHNYAQKYDADNLPQMFEIVSYFHFYHFFRPSVKSSFGCLEWWMNISSDLRSFTETKSVSDNSRCILFFNISHAHNSGLLILCFCATFSFNIYISASLHIFQPDNGGCFTVFDKSISRFYYSNMV